MSKHTKLAGRAVVVTGGARGIGAATARTLADAGMTVVIGDLDADLAAETADALPGSGHLGRRLDVTDCPSFTAFLDAAETDVGPLYALINNAGIMPTGAINLEDDKITSKVIAINLHAVIHGTREAVRRFVPRGEGHILNVSSGAGKISAGGVATYTATKHAVVGFTESVAFELDRTGVDISVVYPSVTRTDLAAGIKEFRGAPTMEATDIATAIRDALERPRFNVPVPRALGPLMLTYQAMPWGVRSRLAKLVKSHSVIDGLNHDARAEYLAKIAKEEPAAER